MRTAQYLFAFYIVLSLFSTKAPIAEEAIEYPPYDGWFNNLAHPDWGGAETQLFRRVPPAYNDGVYEPHIKGQNGTSRPNPIDISDAVFKGDTGHPSNHNRTALLVFFGQQVVEEILDAQRPGCPPEYFNIKIPKGHEMFDKDGKGDIELPLLRSRYDMNTGFSPNTPRQQLNEISSWIDGTLMYGGNKAWTDGLRSFRKGRLRSLQDDNPDEKDFPALNDIRLPMANPPPPRDHKLKPIKRFYMLGNPRGNENTFLLTFGILWYRYHNYWADRLSNQHEAWSDEKIFNEARKMVIGIHQKIVMYDWLPEWLNLPPSFRSSYQDKGYDPTVNPGIAHAFQTSAMRFGHTLVPPAVYRRSPVREDGTCDFYPTTGKTGEEDANGYKALRTCQVYWNPQEGVDEHNIDALLMGMASQITEREDTTITPDLRESVFGPLEFSRRDLMAINIQRGRDHGVPDYNTVRRYYGLTPRTSFDEIVDSGLTSNSTHTDYIKGELERIYDGNINNLDLWPAGMLETTRDGPGETFKAIILDQFNRIRHGDRFWFENSKLNGVYTEDEVIEIWNTTIKDIIMNVTGIKDEDIQDNPFVFDPDYFGPGCQQPDQLNASDRTHMAECTMKKTFDYFSGSEISYALSFTFLFATLFGAIGALFIARKFHKRRVEAERQAIAANEPRHNKAGYITAEEWVSKKEGCREVHIWLEDKTKQINVKNHRDKLLRTIDIQHLQAHGSTDPMEVIMSADHDMRMMLLRVPREYDLVLQFPNSLAKNDFYEQLKNFATRHGLAVQDPRSDSIKNLMKEARTKKVRQQLLDRFFREIFARAFKVEGDFKDTSEDIYDTNSAKDVLTCELTKHEFAETLQLKPTSLFVTQMFEVVDKDKNGYISFREFLDMIVIFFNGSAEKKAKLMFDMYDVDGSGRLTFDDLKTMIRSMMDLANDSLDDKTMDEVIHKMFGNMSDKSRGITFEEFQNTLKDYQGELQNAKLTLNIDGVQPTFLKRQNDAPVPDQRQRSLSRAERSRATMVAAYRNKKDEEVAQSRRSNRLSAAPSRKRELENDPDEGVSTKKKVQPKGKAAQTWQRITSWFETKRREIFWVTLYTLVLFGVFIERAYYYSIEREHAGLRQIAGYGVSITRGAASAMMFTYSCLLVTMCRNTITYLRETFLHRYIPFDAAIDFHKYIAWWALLFTVMHCIGHSINFYHISTQTADDLTCLFRNFFHATDELPKFTYWLYGTITGFTGVLATIVVFIMYVFAQQFARRWTFRGFYLTHHLYIVLYILMIMHGSGRLVQPPFFHYFFLAPAILFTLDKLVSISRRKVEIQVVKAELLPSGVTHLKFQKPDGFDYKSGQWVRIACIVQNESEYHPFTLTSAPHEKYLSLHIRAVGPWTTQLRKTYDPNRVKEHAWPRIFLDGPYGEGHQDWFKFDVAVLVGGGIGVTPFASILKDIAHRSRNKEKIACKKVYFLWVTRTQKQFEWMTDIIRKVEENDLNDIVAVHIFITQYKEKFDVRTTMLYICERYFQKISSRSLFTGLRSVTHFGRPQMEDFLDLIQQEHNDAQSFGVFSCGPPPMTASVERACVNANKQSHGDALFVHHYENF